MSYNQVLHSAVVFKLKELSGLPVGFESGRRLTADDLREKGIDLTAEQVHLALATNFKNVAERLGIEFFMATPAAALEQFTLMSILRNEDCAGMLKSLINSFMLTYITAETSDKAFSHLLGLESLRAEVAKSRNLTPAPMKPHPPRSHH